MLDRESACNRVFLADGVGIRFEPCSFAFQAGRCPEIDDVVTAALCRPIETSSDVDDNKRARHRRPCRQRNGTKPKFINDFSRARACACARCSVRSESAKWDIKDNTYRVFVQGEWIVVPDDALILGSNKFGKAIVWLQDYADLASGEIQTITRIRCFIPGSGV